jgi:hypothetical protein
LAVTLDSFRVQLVRLGSKTGKYSYRPICQYMEKVPIRTVNFRGPAERVRHDEIVALVCWN